MKSGGGLRGAVVSDRNPLRWSTVYDNAGLAPAGATVRATYTVPAGRKASIDAAMVAIFIGTPAAPAAFREYYSGIGSTLTAMRLVDIMSNDNVTGNTKTGNIGGAGTLLAGETYVIETLDQSTGGTVAVNAQGSGIEYDA